MVEKLKNALKGVNSKIIIIGHDNYDVDSILSGILASRLCGFLGVENQFVILEPIKNNQSYQIIWDLFSIPIEQYGVNKETDDKNFLLVDHYKTTHKGKVVSCIDHHPTSEEINYEFYYFKKSCSTTFLIYELMREAGYVFSREEIKMIIVGMMIDTVSFMSTKTVKEEVEIAKRLAKKYLLDYDNLKRICMCVTEIHNMTIDEILNNGKKYYDFSSNKVKSAYVQIYEMPSQTCIEKWVKRMLQMIDEEKLKMFVFIIFACGESKTYQYWIRVTESLAKLPVTEMDVFVNDGILSRGTDIMPKVEKFLIN